MKLTDSKCEIFEITNTISDNDIVALNYRLLKTVEPYAYKDSNYNQEIFSIICLMFYNDGYSECDFIFDVTRDREKASVLLHMLNENKVTPCTLRDVIGDFLS